MQEKEIDLIKEVYRHVSPNIVYLSDLESFIEEDLSKSKDIQSFIDCFREEILKAQDQTRKTDFRIYLNELQRRLQRWESSKNQEEKKG